MKIHSWMWNISQTLNVFHLKELYAVNFKCKTLNFLFVWNIRLSTTTAVSQKHLKMPFNQRLKIFEAIKGSTIHQSLATPSSQVCPLLTCITFLTNFSSGCHGTLPVFHDHGPFSDHGAAENHSAAGYQHENTDSAQWIPRISF